MKTIIMAAAIATALTGVAQAAPKVTDNQFLQAARCRGLASSEGLGQLNTQAVDLLLRTEGYPRPLAVKLSSNTKIKAAQTEGDKATGAKKEKLLAERQGACASWLKGGE
ncbi:hypothetical protein [Caulobacter sp. DWR1-3-2b1]|uniref:hypothetical protein n=1 Tax=Caulobacter sp. DWR1-3-2b1 TaxID=2804670 RepID=UPI003CF7B3E1